MITGTELPVRVPYDAFYCGIGIEARCNLKCTMCPRNDPNFEEGEMSYETFTRIADQLPFLREVQLAGLGEPLLHNDLFKMIEYARARKIRSVITTNGTLLNQRNIERIIQSGLGAAHVSIDSPDPEVYKSIRVGATLDHVTSNLRNLVQRRNEARSRLQIIVNSILMRSNYGQVDDMIKLCADLGVDSISFSDMQYFLDVGISKESESLRLAPGSEKDEIRARLAKAQKLADELRIEVGLPSLDQPRVRENCKQPWLYFMVKENDKVRPCCAIHDKEFGDLNQQSYRSIWNNYDFQSFRKRLLSDDVPDECKHCTFL
jgi:radical SAM protein with 4Fe4S-binding SPASM domain